jgi:NADH-quinone oxidoreductase subunit N
MNAPQIDPLFFCAALPILVLSALSLVPLFFPLFRVKSPNALLVIALLGLISSAACFLTQQSGTLSFFEGTLVSDSVGRFASLLILSIAIFVVMLFKMTSLATNFFKVESVVCFLLTVLGMLVMVSTNEFVTLFVGLELSSIGLYILVGYLDPSRGSLEGAIKYFLMGAVVSAFFLMGAALLYAATGSLNLSEIAQVGLERSPLLFHLGLLFVQFSLMFKLALMPFHSWAPDAYEAAPTGITAFMATTMKVMIFVVLFRCVAKLPVSEGTWPFSLSLAAILSILAGNIMALAQSGLKRMLAYSSIAHSGFMVMALCAIAKEPVASVESVMFYLMGYSLASLLAFGIIMALEDMLAVRNLQLHDMKGLAKRAPWAAVGLTVALLSFAGFPLTAGFFGKFFVLISVMREEYYTLAVVAALGSTISLFYYLRVVVAMFFTPSESTRPLPASYSLRTFMLATAVAVLVLGTLIPEMALQMLRPIAEQLLR